MMTFDDFRNQAVQIWRDDDIARHRDKVGFLMHRGERLLMFEGGRYAAVAGDSQFRTMVNDVMFTRSSRTAIARVLYALSYIHRTDALQHRVNDCAAKASARGAFEHLAGTFGIEEVDPHLLSLTIRVNEPHWARWDMSERVAALCNWMITELRTWPKTPKTEHS